MSEESSPAHQLSGNLERLSFLSQIEKQHDLIKEILEQIHSLQSLGASLTKLFNNTGKLSPSIKKAFSLLDALDDEQKALATAKVELRLDHLEFKIRAELSYYLELIGTIEEIEDDEASAEKLQELTSYSRISEFKRKVSLALAYRVLLFERDVEPSEFNLDVAPDLLNKALHNIDEKKEYLKTELTTQFSSFHENILSFAKKACTSKDMSAAMYKIADSIEVNLLHLNSGKPSEELPTSIIEIEDQIKLAAEIDQDASSEENPLPSLEERKKEEEKHKKQGLLGRINVWVNTPDSTSWKETKK